VRSRRPDDEASRAWEEFGGALDHLMSVAERQLPADRMRVLRSSAEKLQSALSKTSYHIALFLDQYARLSSPSGPRGPATVHRLHPRRRRKR